MSLLVTSKLRNEKICKINMKYRYSKVDVTQAVAYSLLVKETYEIGSTNTVTNKVSVTNSDINLINAYFTYVGLMQK